MLARDYWSNWIDKVRSHAGIHFFLAKGWWTSISHSWQTSSQWQTSNRQLLYFMTVYTAILLNSGILNYYCSYCLHESSLFNNDLLINKDTFILKHWLEVNTINAKFCHEILDGTGWWLTQIHCVKLLGTSWLVHVAYAANELTALYLNGWLAFTKAVFSAFSDFLWNPPSPAPPV